MWELVVCLLLLVYVLLGVIEIKLTYSEEDNIHECSSTHSEEESRDGSAACHVNHGQHAGEVALSGTSKEQSVRDGHAIK